MLHGSGHVALSAFAIFRLLIFLVFFGCPTYRANAARLRLANGSGNHLFYNVSMSTKIVTIGTSSSVFRKR